MYELIIELKEDNLDFEIEANENLDIEINRNVERVIEKDYNKLSNKPQINNVELINNKSLEEIGVETLTNSEMEEILRED